jgi:hypothetical protein
MKNYLAAFLIVLASIAGGLFYPAAWVRGSLLDLERAAQQLDGLEQNPAVASALAELAVEETLKRVDLEEVARPILGSLFDLLGGEVETLLVETATGVIQSGRLGAVWNVLANSTFAELSMAVSQPEEPTTSVGLNLSEIAQDLFVEIGLPPDLVPTADWRVAILEPADLGNIRDYVQPTLTFGPWLPWISLALVIGAIAIARRSFGPIGAWLMASGVITAIAVWLARQSMDNQIDGITSGGDRAAVQAIADALIADGISSSIRAGAVLVGLGIVVLIAGWVIQRPE